MVRTPSNFLPMVRSRQLSFEGGEVGGTSPGSGAPLDLEGRSLRSRRGVEPEKVVLQKFLSKGSREGKGVGEGAVLRTFGPEKPELAALLLEKVETGVFEEESGEENLKEPGGQNRQILLRRDDAGEGDEVFPGRVGPPVEKPVDKLFQEGVEGVEDQHSKNRRRPDGDPLRSQGETGDERRRG